MKRSHNTDGKKTQNDKQAKLTLINQSSEFLWQRGRRWSIVKTICKAYATPVSLEPSLDKRNINAVDGVIDFRYVWSLDEKGQRGELN